MGTGHILFWTGLTFAFIGALIVALYFIAKTLKGSKTHEVQAGGVILIGPIPIIFGEGRKSIKLTLVLALLGLALTLLLLLLEFGLR